ncbi:toll/interleukin-1 receptor domain-containing protein [Marilutibacter aestuarii]|uniref:Toll/interleukin-1 receptor domain-containing protein n=1 Tax=Marilutibacter aestuarii TaxID=1706195 RepID=A0A508ADS7_9GAMM|nr:toll/interleukin-1 receptor domain-containing protein [Lysobacter aestuarii]TQD45205.1 toll/interleukin-1 receptor domain-containing protein [Lysobacter aestuarii]
MPVRSPTYHAFISYSHADRVTARWLHRALEGYRLPRRLVGRSTALGPVPATLSPIFKDREELGAAADLSAELRVALDASRFLVVIASPDAARSRWVNEEIRAFKQGHGDDRVLVLIVAGEPGASRMPGREAEECFPEALRFRVDAEGLITGEPAEPVAADLRRHGDGKRLALLKLVAGLTGLRLDDLVQRDSQRRQKRLAWLATAATVGMLAMGGLALMAGHARDEAQHQRAQAEGLIEFMLTDLRRKLEPVGRLDVMDSVGQRAMAYYGQQQPARLDADALGRRSRALLLVGEVRNLRGDLDGALATYRQAADTTAEQLRRDPGNPQRIFDHAQGEFWVGYVAWQRGDAAPARRHLGRYRDLATRLTAIDPANDDWLIERVYAETNLGALELSQDRPVEALAHFDRALDGWLQLRERSGEAPEQVYQFAQTLAWQADAKRRMGESAAALGLRREEGILYRQLLVDDPKNTKVREALSVSLVRAAQLELERGNDATGAALAGEGVATIESLRAQDPANRLWLEMAVKAANVHAESLMLSRDWDGAAEVNARALADANALVEGDRSVTAWRTDGLLPARWMQAAILVARGEHEAAAPHLQRFVGDFSQDAGAKSPDARFGWLVAKLLVARNARALDDEAAAAQATAEARAYLASLDGGQDARFRAVADWLAPPRTRSPRPEGGDYRLTALVSETPHRR